MICEKLLLSKIVHPHYFSPYLLLAAIQPRLKGKHSAFFSLIFPQLDESKKLFSLRVSECQCTKLKSHKLNNEVGIQIEEAACSPHILAPPEVSNRKSMKRTCGAEVIFVVFISPFAVRQNSQGFCNHFLCIYSFLVELPSTI